MATKYKKQKNGLYMTRVWDGTYKNGRKHYAMLTSNKSSRDLEKKVETYRENVRNRKQIRTTDISFHEYANTWLTVYKAGRAGNTIRMYKNIIEKHLCILNGISLQDIDRIHVQSAINHADGHPATQAQIRMTLQQIIQSAVADHLFPANVASDIFLGIDRIKYVPPEKRTLTEVEKEALFKAAFKESDRVFVYLLYGCGLRREEALALTIFDINTKKREVTINKAHELINGSVRQKEPKTKNGFRIIPIPATIFPTVERYIHDLKANGKTFLFTMKNGKPVTKSSYVKMWDRILSAMQKVSDEPITGLTAHIFRHNYCTTLCYQIPAISIKHIAKLMGDTEAVVLKTYNHIVLEKENAFSVVDQAL